MFSQFLTFTSTIGLLVLGASGRPEDRPLYPMVNSSSSITNGSSQLRDPCLDNSFQPPVYQITNLTVSKEFVMEENYPSSVFATFDITDVANQNHSFHCAWQSGADSRDYWRQFCTPVGGGWLAKRSLTLMNLHPWELIHNRSNEEPIRFVEYWFCDIKNGEIYPQVYQSRADMIVDVTCPFQGTIGVEHFCTISNQLPMTVKSQWQPTGALPGTRRLVPRLESGTGSGGLYPPPSRDCTEVSLTHPDWVLSEFTYTPGIDPEKYETAIVTFSLEGRASGTRVTCGYGGKDGTAAEGELLILACSPHQNASLESHSRLAVKFHSHDRWLSIQEDWTCGDTKGLHSTNFTAIANLTIPGLVPGPMTIKGSLTKPVLRAPALIPAPPGSDSPICRYGPFPYPIIPFGGPAEPPKDMWTLTRFFYESKKGGLKPGTFNGTLDPSWVREISRPSLEFELRNEAIGFTQSCKFTDDFLHRTTDHWFHCADPKPLHAFPRYSIETYFQFNRDLGTIKVNQTWYCDGKEPQNLPVKITGHGSTRDGRYWYGTPIACGSGINVVKNVTCWIPEPPCDYVVVSEWCSLYASRDGRPEGYPLRGGPYGGGIPMTDNLTEALPSNALTAPDPVPDKWSCTVASLGQGPVTWTLMTPYSRWFAHTFWYGDAEDSAHDQLNTRLEFELASSVFQGMDADPYKGWVHYIGSGRDWPGAMTTLTPWLRGWDPTNTMRGGGTWGQTFYNGIDWAVRLDLTTGYMELNHSWYCDDKDPLNP